MTALTFSATAAAQRAEREEAGVKLPSPTATASEGPYERGQLDRNASDMLAQMKTLMQKNRQLQRQARELRSAHSRVERLEQHVAEMQQELRDSEQTGECDSAALEQEHNELNKLVAEAQSSASAAQPRPALPPTGGDSSSDDEEDNRAAAADAPPVHAPFKAPDPTRTVLFEDDDDDDDAAPPPPGSPRCVVCSTTQDVFIVERAKDLLRAEFYAWCCSSCARDVWKTISVSGARNSARTRRKILISHRRGNMSSRGPTPRSSASPRTTTSRSAPSSARGSASEAATPT